MFGDVYPMGRNVTVQVLHEEAAPQHCERHGTRPQRRLHLVVRDEPCPVGTEYRYVNHVTASRVLRRLKERKDRLPRGPVPR